MKRCWTYVWLLLCLYAIHTQANPTQPVLEKITAASTNPFKRDHSIQVRLGAENSWPPYSDHKGQGISTNIIKAAFAHQGIKPSFHAFPYSRVLHDLQSGKIDGGYNVTLQSTTAKKFIFGKVPLMTVESHWYFMPGQHPGIRSIHDIPRNFKVGVILDYEYGEEYERHRHRFQEVRVSQQSQIIRMLKQGRLDAGLMFGREAELALQQMNLDHNTLEKRFLNHRGDVYVAFSYKKPRSRWLAEQLDQGLIALKVSGEYYRLANIPIPEPHPPATP